MAVPWPVYCSNCGGFTGEHQMGESSKVVEEKLWGRHLTENQCINHLRERIEELENSMSQLL